MLAARVSPEQKFTFYSANLTNAEEAKRAIISWDRVPDIVICCAGIPWTFQINSVGVAIPGFFADQSTEVLEDSLKTIYLTTLWTAHVYSQTSN
jgi:NAD(P)-dependent dehydrogenase (short-subunit alcohol dehydrogenase family)